MEEVIHQHIFTKRFYKIKITPIDNNMPRYRIISEYLVRNQKKENKIIKILEKCKIRQIVIYH